MTICLRFYLTFRRLREGAFLTFVCQQYNFYFHHFKAKKCQSVHLQDINQTYCIVYLTMDNSMSKLNVLLWQGCRKD